jgi:hypothetical protein
MHPNGTRIAMRYLGTVLVVGVVVGVFGCGGTPGQVPTYPVTGSVAVGGQPAVGALVVLFPEKAFDEKADNPRGVVGKDGAFAISTYAQDDGAPAGKYRVVILPPASNDESSRFDPRARSGEERYKGVRSHETSRLEVTVESKSNALQPFRIE